MIQPDLQITFACKKATIPTKDRKGLIAEGQLRIGEQPHPFRPDAIHHIFFIPMLAVDIDVPNSGPTHLESPPDLNTVVATCPLHNVCKNCSGTVAAAPVPGTDYYSTL